MQLDVVYKSKVQIGLLPSGSLFRLVKLEEYFTVESGGWLGNQYCSYTGSLSEFNKLFFC